MAMKHLKHLQQLSSFYPIVYGILSDDDFGINNILEKKDASFTKQAWNFVTFTKTSYQQFEKIWLMCN